MRWTTAWRLAGTGEQSAKRLGYEGKWKQALSIGCSCYDASLWSDAGRNESERCWMHVHVSEFGDMTRVWLS